MKGRAQGRRGLGRVGERRGSNPRLVHPTFVVFPLDGTPPLAPPPVTIGRGSVRPGPGTPSAAAAPAAAPIVTGTRRRRNADSADRDSVRYARQVRNRESAKRSNERRVRRVLAETAELAKLSKLLPLLVKRRAELEAEQADLRARLGMRPRVGVGQE